jgi:hypothetical protein
VLGWWASADRDGGPLGKKRAGPAGPLVWERKEGLAGLREWKKSNRPSRLFWGGKETARDAFFLYIKLFLTCKLFFQPPILWIQTKIGILHDSIEANIITKENLCHGMNTTIKYINPKLI